MFGYQETHTHKTKPEGREFYLNANCAHDLRFINEQLALSDQCQEQYHENAGND